MIGPASLESLYHATYSKNKYISKVSPLISTASPTSTADRICISKEGSLLQAVAKATAAVGSVSSVSQQHLDSLREQISAGTYQIPSTNIASSMLNRGLDTQEAAK